MQVKDQTFSNKNPASLIAFLQYCKAVCDKRNIHKYAKMWFFRRYLSGPIDVVIKARVALPTESGKTGELCKTSFSAIVKYLLKWFTTDDNIATIDANIRNFK